MRESGYLGNPHSNRRNPPLGVTQPMLMSGEADNATYYTLLWGSEGFKRLRFTPPWGGETPWRPGGGCEKPGSNPQFALPTRSSRPSRRRVKSD